MSGKRKSSSPGNQDIKRFFMVRQESSLPPETEKRSDSIQDGGTEKTETEKKQQIHVHLHWMRFNQLKQKEVLLPYKYKENE